AQASFGMKGSDKGQFDQPRGLTFTPDGNIAVVDSKNGRVQVMSPEGEFLLEFGKEYLNTEYSGPCDVACDREGNFYIADTWNHAIRKASPKGQLLKTAKEALQDGGPTGLFGPRGIALSSEGKVYVTDTGHKYVRVYDGNLNPLFSWGGGGEATGLFNEPVGIAIDAQDRVFVADTGNGRIQQFSARGDFQAEYQTALPGANELIVMEPHLEALPDGRLVQTVSKKGAIWFVNPEAKTAVILRIVQPAISEPLGVAVGPRGALWVSDRKSGVIARAPFQK
ncbi:MAG TPA: NHL repeat-containing protein, partial [Sumerlaeia bacterium]|nr:NHL repeat-containing protein [Sumerlaeia bacterium]